MSKCGKSFMPECEYFTTSGCISPFNCPYKTEHESITTATSTPLNSNVIYTYETYKDKEIARLTEENEQLRARLGNAIELPCKVGDKIYDIFENHTREWEVVKILLVKDGYFVQCGHQGTDDYMHVSNKEYGLWWFTDRTKAEAKLKEVGGGE